MRHDNLLILLHAFGTLLVTSVPVKIKRKDAFAAPRPLQDLAMAQRPSGIAITCPPMFLHAEARKLIVLGMALIALRSIDQMNEVVDRAVGGAAEQSCFRAALEVVR